MVNHILAIPTSEAPFFTVDTTKDFVTLSQPGTTHRGTFKDSNGLYYFRRGDNVRIDSVGINLPFGFHFDMIDGVYSGGGAQSNFLMPSIGLYMTDGESVFYPTGLAAALQIPSENLDIPIDVFTNAIKVGIPAPYEGYFVGSVFLGNQYASATLPRVSMAGVGSNLNGKKFYAYVYLRAASNFGTYQPPA